MKVKTEEITTFDEISELIVSAIRDEHFFSKDVLIPKVRAILRGFKLKMNATNYHSIESPSAAARRLRTIELNSFELKFWKDKLKEFVGEDLQKYYDELDEERKRFSPKKSLIEANEEQ